MRFDLNFGEFGGLFILFLSTRFTTERDVVTVVIVDKIIRQTNILFLLKKKNYSLLFARISVRLENFTNFSLTFKIWRIIPIANSPIIYY